MIDKFVRSIAAALEGINDGSTVLVGGFGAVGRPNALIEGLIEQGARDLTVVANNAGTGHAGLARLMECGRVRTIGAGWGRIVWEDGGRRWGGLWMFLAPQRAHVQL